MSLLVDTATPTTGGRRRLSAQPEPQAGGRAGSVGSGALPQVEEHVGLLVQNHLDVAGMDQGIVHLVPLPVACLKRHRVRKAKQNPNIP